MTYEVTNKNYIVTAVIGNPSDPSRIDLIGVYRTKKTAEHYAVNTISNGYYAPAVIGSKHKNKKRVVSKQYKPLIVTIEETDSNNLSLKDHEKEIQAYRHFEKKMLATNKYLQYKKVKCKCCNNEFADGKDINAENPISALCNNCKEMVIVQC